MRRQRRQFLQASRDTIPYSERKPERCDAPDDDPDEIPSPETLRYERSHVHTVGYPHLKRR